MNTNMAGFRLSSKIFASCALDESSLSIGRVNYLLFLDGFLYDVPEPVVERHDGLDDHRLVSLQRHAVDLDDHAE